MRQRAHAWAGAARRSVAAHAAAGPCCECCTGPCWRGRTCRHENKRIAACKRGVQEVAIATAEAALAPRALRCRPAKAAAAAAEAARPPSRAARTACSWTPLKAVKPAVRWQLSSHNSTARAARRGMTWLGGQHIAACCCRHASVAGGGQGCWPSVAAACAPNVCCSACCTRGCSAGQASCCCAPAVDDIGGLRRVSGQTWPVVCCLERADGGGMAGSAAGDRRARRQQSSSAGTGTSRRPVPPRLLQGACWPRRWCLLFPAVEIAPPLSILRLHLHPGTPAHFRTPRCGRPAAARHDAQQCSHDMQDASQGAHASCCLGAAAIAGWGRPCCSHGAALPACRHGPSHAAPWPRHGRCGCSWQQPCSQQQ